MNKKLILDERTNNLFQPKKSLGQNFLTSFLVLKEIIHTGELKQSDMVVEIGPGKGFLTQALVKKVQKIILIEKDEILANNLKKEIWFLKNQKKLVLFSEDALLFNFSNFFEKEKIEKYKLIANIPYYITGKILRIFQEMKFRPELAVLLVQKEVAERLCAPKGKKSLLSIVMDYYGFCQMITVVDKKDFFPVPKVDSAVVKIVFKKNEQLFHQNQEERNKFFSLIKKGYASKRKTLFNNLKSFYSKELIKKSFLKANLDLKVRAQELIIDDWLVLDKFFAGKNFL